jgi:hypothetical protein
LGIKVLVSLHPRVSRFEDLTSLDHEFRLILMEFAEGRSLDHMITRAKWGDVISNDFNRLIPDDLQFLSRILPSKSDIYRMT